MVRITRRDFLKYCSIAAGALGLSASTLMKVERVLANTAAPTVVWIAGSACTGCTMSLLNSVFYTTVDDLLLNRINLVYLDTAMATAGAYTAPGVQYTGANALAEARRIYTGTAPFVLVVEGAIPTGTPPGGAPGDYCRIGDLTDTGPESVLDNVSLFANHASCLAVLSVGTCSSFGGIPGAQGNVTGAKGVAFSGTTMGGAIVTNSNSVNGIIVKNAGSGYSQLQNPVTVTVDAPPSGTAATASATAGIIITLLTGGSGYSTSSLPVVAITGTGTGATASAIINDAGSVKQIIVTNPGSGYTSAPTVTITGGTVDATASAVIGITSIRINNPALNSGYTSIPDVTIAAPAVPGTTATAYVTSLIKGNVKTRTGLAAKVINISGCPPHPDWIVGTIAHILDTALTLPAVNANYQPVDYGYKEYQCNAGPCPWRFNNSASKSDYNSRYPEGNSKDLGKYKWTGLDMGCIGILGCKGRKTKADCSRRRWNADAAQTYGVNWCVGSRAGCHGCTEPAFPDKVGKFFTFA